jgi:hypothetical protein
MKRYLIIPFLAAALSLTACKNFFPSLDPTPSVDPVETISAEAAYEKVKVMLEPFARRGISRTTNVVPAQAMLYYIPWGQSQAESVVVVNSPTWVFCVGPDANANGENEWMYVYLNAANGEWGGQILKGEIVGLTWDTLREKDEHPDNFTLFRAETINSASASKWLEISEGSQEIEKEGQHAWIRRYDSEAELKKAYSGNIGSSAVDWDTQTLLLAAGVEMSQNRPYDLTLTAKENGHWEIGVCRVESAAQAVLWWTRAVLVDKLPADASLTVKTTFMGK